MDRDDLFSLRGQGEWGGGMSQVEWGFEKKIQVRPSQPVPKKVNSLHRITQIHKALLCKTRDVNGIEPVFPRRAEQKVFVRPVDFCQRAKEILEIYADTRFLS